MPGVRIKDHWNELRIFEQRALIAGAIIGALVLLLIGRLVLLQIIRHDYYTELSQGNRVRIEPLPAPRGLILDRHGDVLAENRPAYQLELVREQVPDLDDTLRRLAALGFIAPDDLDDVRKQILSRRAFDGVPVKLRLEEEEIARFAVHRFEFPGVDIRTRLTRFYPSGDLAVHALGYVGAISESDLAKIDRAAYAGTSLIGKLGVEAAYENELHGTNGTREVLVNAEGRSVQKQGAFTPRLTTTPPVSGADLILSIDLPTQRAGEDGLLGRRGAVVAIDPSNGDVIALVSRPGFDPALFARGITRAEYAALSTSIDKPLFNRALRGTYPSGSTIKPVIALAGLTSKVVTPEESVFCAGQYHLPGSRHLFREGRGGKHGRVAMAVAIARSCDVYFYGLSSTLGVDRIAAFLAPFGYGAVTGIDISGEKAGILPSREWKKRYFKRPQDQVWFPGETVNFGIGQGYLLVTPLQLAHVAGELASRGKSYRPRLVTAVRDPNGKIERLPPKENPAIEGLSDADWDIVHQGMVGATSFGTAALVFRGAAYTVAGKTGTAQVFSVAQNAKYDEKTVDERLRDHSWFIAFAPVEAPRIAIAVLVENGGFGASAAAPIARKMMDAYLVGTKPPTGTSAGTPNGAPTAAEVAAAAAEEN